MKQRIVRALSPGAAMLAALMTNLPAARASEPQPPMTPYQQAFLDCQQVSAANYLERKASGDILAQFGMEDYLDPARCRADPIKQRKWLDGQLRSMKRYLLDVLPSQVSLRQLE